MTAASLSSTWPVSVAAVTDCCASVGAAPFNRMPKRASRATAEASRLRMKLVFMFPFPDVERRRRAGQSTTAIHGSQVGDERLIALPLKRLPVCRSVGGVKAANGRGARGGDVA